MASPEEVNQTIDSTDATSPEKDDLMSTSLEDRGPMFHSSSTTDIVTRLAGIVEERNSVPSELFESSLITFNPSPILNLSVSHSMTLENLPIPNSDNPPELDPESPTGTSVSKNVSFYFPELSIPGPGENDRQASDNESQSDELYEGELSDLEPTFYYDDPNPSETPLRLNGEWPSTDFYYSTSTPQNENPEFLLSPVMHNFPERRRILIDMNSLAIVPVDTDSELEFD